MNVYVCGDTHIPTDINKLSIRYWEIQKYLCKDDLVISLGDCGLLWEQEWSKEELWWAKWLTAKNFTVCFLDGNHENFDRINALEVVDFHGGKAGKVFSDENGTIYHLKRGEIYEFGDKKVFTFGGALSVDKEHRTTGISWWEQELPNYAECDYALSNLEKHNYSVDYVLTHTCPASIVKSMNFDLFEGERFTDPCAKFLNVIDERTSFRQWHFGHFHTSAHKNEKYICHYNWDPVKLT